MGLLLKRRTVLAAGLLATLAGCGGGGSSSSSSSLATNTARGTATVVLALPAQPTKSAARATSRNKFPPITLPPYAGNIPFGTNAVKVGLTNPTTGAQIAAPRLVTVPTSGVSLAPQLTVQLTDVPVGPVRVTATAYADAQAATPALAVGMADTQITSNMTASVDITMALTADHLVPSTTALVFGPDETRASFIVQVMDKNGTPTGFPVQFLSADPDVATTEAGRVNEAVVVRGAVPGTTQIIAYEPNSGLNTIISVTSN